MLFLTLFFSQYLITADIGDLNFDGLINVLDMLLISDNVLDGERYNYLADYNKDKNINLFDIISMRINILNN